MRLAIVIPTLNEAERLGPCLEQASEVADEVVVSDGGSTDASCVIARQAGAQVVCGKPGRGGQLARGAHRAIQGGADVLLFLHADTGLPPGARRHLEAALAGRAVGGGFLVRFDDPRPILRLGSWLVCLRTRWFRVPLGDQAQFVRASVLEQMGGFKDWAILEDLDFIRRLGRYGRIAIIRQPVTTAARRFNKRGVLRTVATNWLIWTLFALGVRPARLARLYRHIR